MARHIGIVACSAEGAALCYRTLCAEAPAVMGEHMHPEVCMHTHPLGEYINRIIFAELVNGVFTERSRRYFNAVMQTMRDRGCDGVVLGCTEIPLLVDPDECPLPTLDSTRLLARAALTEALKPGLLP